MSLWTQSALLSEQESPQKMQSKTRAEARGTAWAELEPQARAPGKLFPGRQREAAAGVAISNRNQQQ